MLNLTTKNLVKRIFFFQKKQNIVNKIKNLFNKGNERNYIYEQSQENMKDDNIDIEYLKN